jgi:hypothetical protein
VDPVGSGQEPVVGFCKYGDEPSGSGATEVNQENKDLHMMSMYSSVIYFLT